MAAPVIVRFQVEGIEGVKSALRSVEDAFVRSDKRTEDSAKRTTRTRITEEERVGRENVRASEKAEKDKSAAAEKWAKYRARIVDTSIAMEERAEREKAAATEKWARVRARIVDRSIAMEASAAKNKADNEIREAKRSHDSHMELAKRLGAASFQGAMNGASRVAGVTRSVATTALGLGGGFSVADSLQETMGLQRSVARLANSADGVNGVTAKDLDQKKIMDRAKAASVASGIDAGDLVDATRGYVAKSSDFKGGMENMEFFGKLAKGTGSDVKDVARAAGIIRSQNKNLDADGAKKMLLSVVMQGKQGAVEIDQLALNAGKITRGSTAYAGDQAVNQQKLLGLAQIAVRTAGTPAAAATALSSLGNDTRRSSADLTKLLGHDVLDKNGKITMAPEELLAEVLGATGGNLKKLGQGKGNLGFTKPTMKLFEALSPEFTKAQSGYLAEHEGDTKGANKAGAAASLEEMTKLTGQTMSSDGLEVMVKRVLDTPAEQFEAVIRQLKTELGEALLPEFQKLLPVIKEMVPTFIDLAKTSLPAFVGLIKSLAEFADKNKDNIKSLAEHPIGTLVAFEVSKSFAAAALPALLKSLLTAAMGGGGPTPGGVPGAAGGGGGLVVAGAALSAAYIADTVGGTVDAVKKGKNEGESALAMMRSDNPETRAKGKAMYDAAKKKTGAVDTANSVIGTAGSIASFMNPTTMLGQYLGDKAVHALGKKTERDRTEETIQAKELINVVELRKDIAAALVGGVSDAQGGRGGADDPVRSQSLASPSRGGTD